MTRTSFSRRNLLNTSALGLAGGAFVSPLAGGVSVAAVAAASRALQIKRIDRTTVKLPFREIPARNMARELPHWAWFELCEMTLNSGHVGIGETMLYYTWGVTTDVAVQRALGQSAAELMWDDSLGAGLQMALFDAVARVAEVPIHRLFSRQLYQRTPLAWWNIDTSPEDMAAECATAHAQGYRAYKTKGRPWIDVWGQLEQPSKVVPTDFRITLDFNDTLLDATRGIPILKELAQTPQMGIFETPIPQSDLAGNQAIRKATRVPVAMHYGNPRPPIALKEEVCDGFVIGGGASALLRAGAVAAMADKPFWLQLVGSGLTAAYAQHFGAVLSHATWPAVNCHQLFTHTLLKEPIVVKDGTAAVPDRPGLGYEPDRDAIARFRVDKPAARPDPPRLIETRWPDGRHMYFANNRPNFMLEVARRNQMPYFERGVRTRLVPDDGTPRWRRLYEEALQGPKLVKD